MGLGWGRRDYRQAISSSYFYCNINAQHVDRTQSWSKLPKWLHNVSRRHNFENNVCDHHHSLINKKGQKLIQIGLELNWIRLVIICIVMLCDLHRYNCNNTMIKTKTCIYRKPWRHYDYWDHPTSDSKKSIEDCTTWVCWQGCLSACFA